MKSSVWRRYSVVAVCLTLATACVALAEASSESTAHKKGKNSQSTQKYVDLLSKLFDKWDLNSDDYLDKEELAKAFRGPNAKPYDYKKDYPDNDAATDTSKDDSKDSTTTKKPNYTNYPDYTFLMRHGSKQGNTFSHALPYRYSPQLIRSQKVTPVAAWPVTSQGVTLTLPDLNHASNEPRYGRRRPDKPRRVHGLGQGLCRAAQGSGRAAEKGGCAETRLQSASGKEARSIERQLRREQAKIDRMISQIEFRRDGDGRTPSAAIRVA